MKKTTNQPTHIEIRNELLKMQKRGGAVITPLALYKIVSLMLQNENGEADLPLVKTIVETYCSLCNEYYKYCYSNGPKEEFYVQKGWWKKYFIDPKTMKQAIQFLTLRNYIQREIEDPNNPTSVIIYKINLDKMTDFREAAELLHQQEQAKRNTNAD